MIKKIFSHPLRLLLLSFLCMIFHNLFYALFGIEEAVFFSLTFVFAIAFLVSLLLGLFHKKSR